MFREKVNRKMEPKVALNLDRRLRREVALVK